MDDAKVLGVQEGFIPDSQEKEEDTQLSLASSECT